MKANLRMFKLKISTKGSFNSERWDHEDIDSTPRLDYDFNTGSRWKANDPRLANKQEVYTFSTKYWERRTIDPSQPKYHYFGPNKSRRSENSHRITNNLSLYEDELEREIQKAIAKVNERFQNKFDKDFEHHFEDKFVKFVRNKELA